MTLGESELLEVVRGHWSVRSYLKSYFKVKVKVIRQNFVLDTGML